MRAEILAIGSELLHGGRVDTNSLFIADLLAEGGVQIRRKTALGDEISEIQKALGVASRQADVVIVTGGLGATVDDRTREAVAAAFGRPLSLRPKATKILKRQVEKRGKKVSPLMAKQALIPEGARVLENYVGTAPGFYVKEKRAHIFVLPGVPREARDIMQLQVLPIVKRLKSEAFLWSTSFNTVGLSETAIQEKLSPLLSVNSSISLSLLASVKGVKVTLSSWQNGKKKIGRSKRLSSVPAGEVLSQQVKKVLEPWMFSQNKEEMEEVVGNLLASKQMRLALAESCTGGLISHRLTEVPGSSAYLDRALVTYSNKAKVELLGVSPILLRKYGAVSGPVAIAMAQGLRKKSRVDVAVSVTGIAGPGGGSRAKPVGTVYVAVVGPQGTQSECFQFWGNRSEIKFRSSQAALNMIRIYLLSKNP